jgi:hypothetical protein
MYHDSEVKLQLSMKHPKTTKPKQAKTSLEKLLAQAPHSVLCELVTQLCHRKTDLQAQAFEFLQSRVLLDPSERTQAADQALSHYWKDTKKDLTKVKRSGCHSQAEENKIAKKLENLAQKARNPLLSSKVRVGLIDDLFKFIDTASLLFLDGISQIMLAASHSDDERLTLACCFEKIPRNRYLRHIARLIYREVGENEAYLASRLSDLSASEDYYDLAMFYVEQHDLIKAVETAEQGLAVRFGVKHELRSFLAQYALEHLNDRKRYLELLYKNMLECFTLESYLTFQEHCKTSEWPPYEADIMARLTTQPIYTRFPILLHRKEKDKALAVLLKSGEGSYFPDRTILEYAQALENDYPEEILRFYQNFVNDDYLSTGRAAYTKKAKLTVQIRNLYLNKLKQPKQWDQYRRSLKSKNLRRVAYQEEFALYIPDWKNL